MKQVQARRRRGQALAETGVVIIILVLVTALIVEFGRDFMLVNMITHTARDAARFAATLPDRDAATGCLTSAGCTQVRNYVDNILGTVISTNGGSLDPAAVSQPLDAGSGEPLIQVTITGSIGAITGLIPAGTVTVDRSATYRDEQRKLNAACGAC